MSPELELQGLIVTTLKADTAVAALVADRVYDTVPKNTAFPYISMGPVDSTENDAECITGLDVYVQIDVWSQAVGMPECKAIIDAVRRALHDADLSLSQNALVMIEHAQSRAMRDPDGITNHGVCEFTAVVEQS